MLTRLAVLPRMPTRAGKYDAYFDGQAHVLSEPGRALRLLENALRAAARAAGIRITVRTDSAEHTVTVQALL